MTASVLPIDSDEGGDARHDMQTELARTSAMLQEKTRTLEATLASVSQGILQIDPQGYVSLYNQRYLDLMDLPESLLQGHPHVRTLIHYQVDRGDFGAQMQDLAPHVREFVRAQYDAPEDGHMHSPQQYLRRTAAGKYIEVRMHALQDGGHVRTFTDVTEYLQAQEALRESEQRWRSLTQLSSDWYWEQDAEFRFVRFDGNLARALDMPQDELLGRTRWDLPLQNVTPAQWRAHRAQLEAHEVFHDFEVSHLRANGDVAWASTTGEPIFDAQGVFIGYRGISRDITERKRVEAQIERLAFYDELTGLPNRRLLQDRLEQATRVSERQGLHGALLYLDLDNFKVVNDTLGHGWGDQLLVQVGQRLTGCVRASDTVARLGGDEFVVVLQGLHSDAGQAAGIAQGVAFKVQAALRKPYTLCGREVYSASSLGIALIEGRECTAAQLMQRADMAMYQAKEQGRNTLCFFDEGMQQKAKEREALESDMRLGLPRGEFFLYYQRVVNASGGIQGAEALVRWQHPERGMVPPGAFIGVAEQSGLIVDLGHCVLDMACAQLGRWALEAGSACAQWTLSVNVSAQEFRQSDFVQQVGDCLLRHRAPAHLLKLELTESMLLKDVQECIDKMQALRSVGVRFSLDDFGTGYSSLAYLKQLPLSQLKIDQSFVRDVLEDPNDAAIACTVIALGRSMGLEVVAEGVESAQQHAFLQSQGCDYFQGYFFGRPGPVQALMDSPPGPKT